MAWRWAVSRGRPVPLGLDGDDGGHDDTRHAALDPALPPPRPQAPSSRPGADRHGGICSWATSRSGLARGYRCSPTTCSPSAAGSLATVLPALLLIVGGGYQFTPLKRICHARCSSPLFFLMQNWRPGATGALRLGVIHGVDCLGCCAGLMVGLVALGMMNLAWMLTAAVIIFAEKTIPGSHRVAWPLGVLMVAGGVVLLVVSLVGGMAPGMESM